MKKINNIKILFVRNHDTGNINTRLPKSLNKAQGIYPPLGIAYLAAFLQKNGFETKILDAQALNLTTEQTLKEIEKFAPNVFCTTAMTPNFMGAIKACEMAKKEWGKAIPLLSSTDKAFNTYGIKAKYKTEFSKAITGDIILFFDENKMALVEIKGD